MLCWWFGFRDMSSSLTSDSALVWRKPTALNSIGTWRTIPPATSVSHSKWITFSLSFCLSLSFSLSHTHTATHRHPHIVAMPFLLSDTQTHLNTNTQPSWINYVGKWMYTHAWMHARTHVHTYTRTYHFSPPTSTLHRLATILPCRSQKHQGLSVQPPTDAGICLYPPQPFRTWTQRGKQRHGKRTEGSWWVDMWIWDKLRIYLLFLMS